METDTTPLDAEDAVARLLEAETEARAQVGRREAEAARELEAARERARSVLERADARSRAASLRFRERHEASLAELRGAAEAIDARGVAADPRFAWLDRAVERLAAALTTRGEAAEH